MINEFSQLSVTLPQKIVSLPSWLEECQNFYTRIICTPEGTGFPDPISLEKQGLIIDKNVRVGDLCNLIQDHAQDNIWRSWQLFSDENCSRVVSYVPLFIDIDNHDHNLQKAFTLTQDCLRVLAKKYKHFSSDRIRIIFSGMKGFHIEIKPYEPIDNQAIRDELIRGLIEMGLNYIDAKNNFDNGIIDPLSHDFVRLTGTFNSWIDGTVIRKRKVIQLSLDEFDKFRVQDIFDY